MSSVTLLDVVENLWSHDPQLTIYAVKPWTCRSAAVVSREPEDGDRPTEAQSIGATYFIEIFIAVEFLDGWRLNQARPTSVREQCERLIHYATHDA